MSETKLELYSHERDYFSVTLDHHILLVYRIQNITLNLDKIRL
jgi:hypothetical protein